MTTCTLESAINEVADLADDFKNEEYVRGMCELLARCFPVWGMPTDERAEWIENEARRVANVPA